MDKIFPYISYMYIQLNVCNQLTDLKSLPFNCVQTNDQYKTDWGGVLVV